MIINKLLIKLNFVNLIQKKSGKILNQKYYQNQLEFKKKVLIKMTEKIKLPKKQFYKVKIIIKFKSNKFIKNKLI